MIGSKHNDRSILGGNPRPVLCDTLETYGAGHSSGLRTRQSSGKGLDLVMAQIFSGSTMTDSRACCRWCILGRGL